MAIVLLSLKLYFHRRSLRIGKFLVFGKDKYLSISETLKMSNYVKQLDTKETLHDEAMHVMYGTPLIYPVSLNDLTDKCLGCGEEMVGRDRWTVKRKIGRKINQVRFAHWDCIGKYDLVWVPNG